jgi:hypothetical protein
MADLKDSPRRVPPRRRSARTWRWLILAAAAAAVVVVLAVVMVGFGFIGGASAPTGPTAPMTAATARGLPRYYVVAFQHYTNAVHKIADYAVVHDTETGAALATVRVPRLIADGSNPTISGAADDRTFVLTEETSPVVHEVVWCFLLRVAANGRSVKVTRVPISFPPSMRIYDTALSPDGTRLAMTTQWSCGKTRCAGAGIRVVDLATGHVRSWTTQANGMPLSVSWAGNDQLAFEWQTSLSNPPAGQHTGYRLIGVHGAGGDLLAGPAIASPAAFPNYGEPAALVTPDGKDVITSEEQNFRTWTGRVDIVARVIELSARTGRTLRVLYTTTVDHATTGVTGDASSLDSECNVIALGPDATRPLVYCFGFGVLAHGALVTLPGVPSEVTGVPGTGFPSPQSIAW